MSSISLMYNKNSVIVSEDTQLISSGNTPQHYVFAKNVWNYLVGLGYTPQEMESKRTRTVYFDNVK